MEGPRVKRMHRRETISIEESSEMKERLQEPGEMDPIMYSQKREQSPGSVLEIS